MKMEIILGQNKSIEAHYKGHVIRTDQPAIAGGDNTAPAPFDLFLASIGTCAGYYVKMFCDQRGIPTQGIRLEQLMHKNPDTKMISEIEIQIHLPYDFPMQYKDALINAANACAVKKHIATAPVFKVNTFIS